MTKKAMRAGEGEAAAPQQATASESPATRNVVDSVLRENIVDMVQHYLSLHGLIEDSARAEREARIQIRRGIEEGAYDTVHGRGASYMKFLRGAAEEVSRWPAWKRGGA